MYLTEWFKVHEHAIYIIIYYCYCLIHKTHLKIKMVSNQVHLQVLGVNMLKKYIKSTEK